MSKETSTGMDEIALRFDELKRAIRAEHEENGRLRAKLEQWRTLKNPCICSCGKNSWVYLRGGLENLDYLLCRECKREITALSLIEMTQNYFTQKNPKP